MTPVVAPAAAGSVLAVCGLAFEARIVASREVRTVSRGGRSVALAAAIEREIDDGVVALVSFGVAGALTPALRPGALIVADQVVSSNGRHVADRRWSRWIRDRLPHALGGTITGVDRIVANTSDKVSLAATTRADAVDMESHIVARIATERGLPFVVVRAVTDPLERSLPHAALQAMKDDGRVDLPAVLRSLARDPRQLPALLRIGRDTREALGALRQSRLRLGSSLGHADLDQLPVDVV